MSKRRKEDVNWRKYTNKESLKYTFAGFSTAVIAGVFFYIAMPVARELNDSFAVKEFKSIGVIGTYRKHYHIFFEKIDGLATADAREQALVRELASVQKDLDVEISKKSEVEAREETKEIAERLNTEAGSPIARIPDGIEYKVPPKVLPYQLQVLGMEYFRKHDYEKSAVIFHELTHLKEDAGFQNPDNYLVSAISWYKLKHYEMSTDYLRMTQKTAAPGSVLYREAFLWKAIVEKARGRKGESQKALTQLISYYPQSEEASWINQSRAPASKKEKESDE